MRYKTTKVGDLDIFYREAGPTDAPTVLLLHGFPTSSQMFRNLIPALADRYHLAAPDYPGFGHSSMPPLDQFSYTFDNRDSPNHNGRSPWPNPSGMRTSYWAAAPERDPRAERED